MHGPTCVFWANLTPFSLQPAIRLSWKRPLHITSVDSEEDEGMNIRTMTNLRFYIIFSMLHLQRLRFEPDNQISPLCGPMGCEEGGLVRIFDRIIIITHHHASSRTNRRRTCVRAFKRAACVLLLQRRREVLAHPSGGLRAVLRRREVLSSEQQ